MVQGLPHLACPTPSLQWWGNRRGGWSRGRRLGVSRLGVSPCASGSIQSLPRCPSPIPPPPWKQSSSWCRSEHVSLRLLEPSVTPIVFRTRPSAWSWLRNQGHSCIPGRDCVPPCLTPCTKFPKHILPCWVSGPSQRLFLQPRLLFPRCLCFPLHCHCH